MSTIRVLVVEDSLTVRKRITAALETDPELRVVGEAVDGESAVEMCTRLRPDVITLDIVLPGAGGVAATEHIMGFTPTPILVVSAASNRGELFNTYDALAAGAVDVLEKPDLDEDADAWDHKLIARVKLVSRIRVVTHLRARMTSLARPGTPLATAAVPKLEPKVQRLLAIGASTGGPLALVQLLGGLPRNYPLPVVIVLHLGAIFSDSFREWLDGQSPFRVRYAADGASIATLPPGEVHLAPPDRHLVVARGRFQLNHDPERHSCRPSIDTLFESLAREMGSQVAACLLTGMGKDGALGLRAIRAAGGTTIAQDEATSVVFGMPREAILLGGATHVLPLGEIAPTLGAMARLAGGTA